MRHHAPLVAAAVVTILIGSARADRAGVEWSLDRMRTAVLAGDPAAYLACVLHNDPVFVKEQENWAGDLKLHVPTAFRLSIHEPETQGEASEGAGAPVFDDEIGLARFEMLMEWTMPGLGRDGQDVSRSVSYPVVFRRADDGEWRYAGEDWRVVESGGDKAPVESEPEPELPVSDAPNRARCFPSFEEVARNVVKVLPEVRAHVDEGFAAHLTRVQEVKIYPSMGHLQASIYLSYVDGLHGWNEPGESIKLVASDTRAIGHLRTLLSHEYGHVATFELGPKANDMPWWVLEGVAELSAEKFVAMRGRGDDPGEYGRGARLAVERWSRTGKLAAWSELSDFRSVKPELMGHVYQQGHHMVGYVSERFGREGRNRWLRAMGRGLSIDEAARESFGLSFDQLDLDWRAALPPREDGPANKQPKP